MRRESDKRLGKVGECPSIQRTPIARESATSPQRECPRECCRLWLGADTQLRANPFPLHTSLGVMGRQCPSFVFQGAPARSAPRICVSACSPPDDHLFPAPSRYRTPHIALSVAVAYLISKTARAGLKKAHCRGQGRPLVAATCHAHCASATKVLESTR